MSDVLYLAWRYLAYHRFKAGLLVAAIALVLYLPIGLNILVQRGSQQLTARAASTDLIVGAKGSGLELVLRSLYFQSDVPSDLPFSAVRQVSASGFADPIPIHAKYHAGTLPIVGTSIEYFSFRALRPATGRLPAQLGDCVFGARAAARATVEVGDRVMSSPESVFDIAGVYPLKMNVVGILEPTGTPDDDAVFVDVKTTWVIAGLGHGHEDPATSAGALALGQATFSLFVRSIWCGNRGASLGGRRDHRSLAVGITEQPTDRETRDLTLVQASAGCHAETSC